MSLRLHARAMEKYTCERGRRWEGARLKESKAVGKWREGGGREENRAKGAIFHLINNTNQIMQCSTVL